jgi:acyl carrier protein
MGRVALSERITVTNDSTMSGDEQLLLGDVRALLDQLQLDRDHSLTLQSKLTDDLDVDSLALVELCDQLERTFDVSLPDEVFLTASTPQQWFDAVVAARAGTSAPRDANRIEEPVTHTPHSMSERSLAASKRITSFIRAARHARRTRAREGASRQLSDPVGSMLYSLYAWLLLVPFAVSIWLLAVLPLSRARRRDAGRAVARFTSRALGLSVEVEGEMPDTEHPCVIAANHSSFVDGLVLYVFLDQPVTFVASTDMEHQFLLGRIMKGFGCVFVDRGRAERSATSVEILKSTIRSGHHVLIFPEGSISARPGLRVFHLGAFETAASSNCPVVPVGIRGSRDVLRPGSFRPHRGAMRVVVGEPVMPAGNEFTDRVSMRDEVRDAIAHLCGEDGP